MIYRSRTEIISEILKAANGGSVTKTKMMYHAFLSHDQLKDYLMVLTQNDLLSHDLNTRIFKTTEKGLRFLEVYNELHGLIKAPVQALSQQRVQE